MKLVSMYLWLIVMDVFTGVDTECPSFCSECDNGVTCIKCLEGYYLDRVINDCFSCPGGCRSCNSTDYCHSCEENLYGTTCLNYCSNTCPIRKCDKESGECAPYCNDGYFQIGTSCHHCEHNCKTCINRSTECLECQDGFYGPSCQFICSHCKRRLCSRDTCTEGCSDGYYPANSTCYPCSPNCKTCSGSSSHCHTCKDGYYGHSCQNCTEGYYLEEEMCKPCYSDCKTCSNSATECNTCKHGYYGPSCQYKCSLCKNNACSKDNCTEGCRDGYFQISTECNRCPSQCVSCVSDWDCDECQKGHYGSHCQYACQKCIPCIKDNGTCLPKGTPSIVPTTANSTGSGPTTISGANTGEKPGPRADDNIVLYIGVGGGILLVIIISIIIIVVIRKRRSSTSTAQTDFDEDHISMTENEQYISADDFNLTRSARAENTAEDDGLYSMPNKAGGQTNVAMESRSETPTNTAEQNEPPPIPTKCDAYLDEDEVKRPYELGTEKKDVNCICIPNRVSVNNTAHPREGKFNA